MQSRGLGDVYKRQILYILWKTNTPKYMINIKKYLTKLGVNIEGQPSYIDLSVWLDCVDYSKISIGHGVVISREVKILVHDYSISNALRTINKKTKKPCNMIGEVKIGKDSFIGLGSILLPNTTIGEGCIVGAGSVVKGNIEPYSIVVGNPAVKIGDTREWAQNKVNTSEYVQEHL